MYFFIFEGSAKPSRRGTKRSRSSAKASTSRVCKKEVTSDVEIGAEELEEDLNDSPELDLPDLSSRPEPSSRTSAGSAQKEIIQPADIQEVCQRLESIEENMAVSRRLDNLEARLDFAAEQRRGQQQTNSLLNQVLRELSALRRTLSSQNTAKMAGQDPADLASGITIVVPHSQHL